VVLLIIIGAVGGSKKKNVATTNTTVGTTGSATTETLLATTTTTELPTTTVPPTTTTIPHIGSTVTIIDGSGATLVLLSYGPVSAAASYFGVKPGEVEVEVKGCAGSAPISFNPLYFSLIDSESDKIQAELAGTRDQVDSAEVAPGDCVKGSVSFVLGVGLKAKALEFATPLGSVQARWAVS